MISAKSKGESYVIEIEKERVAPLMEVFSGEYSNLASHLKLMNDRMVLVNPRFNNNNES